MLNPKEEKLSIGSRMLILAIIIYPLLLIWQGLMDLQDEGFALAVYQRMFDEPESAAGGYIFNWLQYVLGGAWLSLSFYSLDLVWVRLGIVITKYLAVGFSYLLLRPYIKREHLLPGLFLATVVSMGHPLHYHVLTGLLFVIFTFLFTKGLGYAKNQWIFLAGFVMGLTVFVKLTNILAFALIGVIFFHGYLNKTALRKQFRQSAYFALGYAIAILFAILCMNILGHYALFKSSLIGFFSFASGSSSHSGTKRMISFGMDHLISLLLLMLFLIAIFITSKILSRIRKRYLRYGVAIALAIGISPLLAYKTLIEKIAPRYYNYYPDSMPILLLIGFIYIISLKYIFNIGKVNDSLRLICLISFSLLIVNQFGSFDAMKIASQSSWILVPIALSYVLSLKETSVSISDTTESSSSRLDFGLNSAEIASSRSPIILAFFILSLILSSGVIDRAKMWQSIDHPRLRGILVDRESARQFQELLDQLDNYVNEGDYLISYRHLPLIYFLTNTKPYTGSAWQDVLYEPDELRKKLSQTVKERKYLPVVVDSARSANRAISGQGMNEITTIGVIDEFVKLNGYNVVWSNDKFEIMLPPNWSRSP